MPIPMDSENLNSNNSIDNNISTTDGITERTISDVNSNTTTYGMSLQQSETFSGPLPSPRILKGYADLISDAPERILKMAEEQHQHQISMDESNVKLAEIDIHEGYKAGKRGQYLAFIIGILLIGCGMCAMLTGHEPVALMIFGTSLAAVIAIFIKGIIKKK